jgi:hypothetical protein
MERTEKFFCQGFGKADICGKSIAEICRRVATIHALRSCRKAEQDLWLEMVEHCSVTVGYPVVGFVNDDIVVKRRADLIPKLAR